MTVEEMIESLGSEDVQEQVLVDDDRARERRLERLTEALRQEIANSTRRRVQSPLVESTLATGSFIFKFADSELLDYEVRATRARYRLLPEMISALLSLSPNEFERLCGHVLRLLGCTSISVTASQKDDGVDVIAALPLTSGTISGTGPNNSPFYRVAGHLSFLVYGQAKRYAESNKVNKDEVFELGGSWQAVRNRYFEGTLDVDRALALHRADLRSADPVLVVIMATSSFTRGALDMADSMGIVTLDGEQLGQLLLEASWGVEVDSSGAYAVTARSVRVAVASAF